MSKMTRMAATGLVIALALLTPALSHGIWDEQAERKALACMLLLKFRSDIYEMTWRHAMALPVPERDLMERWDRKLRQGLAEIEKKWGEHGMSLDECERAL